MFTPRSLSVLSLILASLPAAMAGAETPTPHGIVLIDAVHLPPKVPKAHAHLRARIADTLSSKGWMVVQVVSGDDCPEPGECAPALAKETGTHYVLRLSGQRNQDDGYDVRLELFRRNKQEPRETDASCVYCTVERMAGVVGRSAVELLAAAEKDQKDEEALAKKPAAAPAAVVVVPPPAPSPPPPMVAPPTVAPASAPTWMPWALAGVGAAAAGFGIYALARNGASTGSCSDTPIHTSCDHYSSGTLGVLSLVGGGVLLATGTVWALTTHTHTTTVAVSSNRVALHVRF